MTALHNLLATFRIAGATEHDKGAYFDHMSYSLREITVSLATMKIANGFPMLDINAQGVHQNEPD